MSFPTGTEMFQFPAFALLTLCIQAKSTWVHPPDEQPSECIHSRERARFAIASRRHHKGARLAQ